VPDTQITQLLIELRGGRREAFDELFELVYEQICDMAHRRMSRQARGATLDTVALVSEAYLKLYDAEKLTLADRQHFFRVVATAMQFVIVDHARRNLSKKRGGDLRRVDLDATALPIEERPELVIALSDALEKLQLLDERQAHIVQLKFFFGYSTEEVADILRLGTRTVERDWRHARAALKVELTEGVTS
jgi:RNA polymerase sigma factor (TIGR02999 family)